MSPRALAICLAASALTVGCAADETDETDPSTIEAELSATSTQTYAITSRLFKDLQVVVARTHAFTCIPGWTYTEDYQLHYPVCVAPLPAHCTDTYRITHRCVDGV